MTDDAMPAGCSSGVTSAPTCACAWRQSFSASSSPSSKFSSTGSSRTTVSAVWTHASGNPQGEGGASSASLSGDAQLPASRLTTGRSGPQVRLLLRAVLPPVGAEQPARQLHGQRQRHHHHCQPRRLGRLRQHLANLPVHLHHQQHRRHHQRLHVRRAGQRTLPHRGRLQVPANRRLALRPAVQHALAVRVLRRAAAQRVASHDAGEPRASYLHHYLPLSARRRLAAPRPRRKHPLAPPAAPRRRRPWTAAPCPGTTRW